MFEQIMGRVARQRIRREVRNWLYAISELWWPVADFRAMAEENLLPSQLDLPDDVLQLVRGTPGEQVRSVLKVFSNEELLVLLNEASSSHGGVAKAYPFWARAFIQDLRTLLTTAPSVRS